MSDENEFVRFYDDDLKNNNKLEEILIIQIDNDVHNHDWWKFVEFIDKKTIIFFKNRNQLWIKFRKWTNYTLNKSSTKLKRTVDFLIFTINIDSRVKDIVQ